MGENNNESIGVSDATHIPAACAAFGEELMTNDDLGKIKSRRTVTDPLKKRADVSLDSYLHHGLEDFDQFEQDLTNEALPTQHRRKSDRRLDEHYDFGYADKWSQRFEADAIVAAKPSRRVFPSIMPYLAVAIMCGVVSGGVLLYFMVRQSMPLDEEAGAQQIERAIGPGEAFAHVSPSQATSDSPPSAQGSDNPSRALAAASNDANEKVADANSAPSFFSAVDADAKDQSFRPDARPANPTAMPEAIASLKASPETSQNSASGAGLDPKANHPKLTSDQEKKMLKRATDLLAQYDIAGARLIFHYLANHGSAKGAFGLAESYDPKKWSGRHVAGMTPDANEALTWYARAAELGSKDAAAILRKNKP